MTPHRSGNRGTFLLDRQTRVGRIARASGTNHKPTFRRLDQMITVLNETGRDDLLRLLRDGQLKPLACYEAFRVNELHRIPTGTELRPLRDAMLSWLDTRDVSKAQKAADKTAVKVLGQGTIGELATRLTAARETYRKAKHPAQFNRVRASALAFIRDTLKRSHRLYGEVRDVPIMKEKRQAERHILTWTEVQGIAGKLEDSRDRAALYGMVLTGMGPKEWYIDGWKLGENGVTIYGAKRKSRTRIVPSVYAGRFVSPLAPCDVGLARERRRFGERLLSEKRSQWVFRLPHGKRWVG